MARRDFTINAIAKRLETGELLDPFKGREDLEARVLRTVSPESFREDPLRLVRGLRFVSEHDLDPDEQTLAQMRENAESVRLVSAERIGGGLSADGMGELSKLLLGAHPAKALRLARDTGVFAELLPELEAGLDVALDEQSSPRQTRPTPSPLGASRLRSCRRTSAGSQTTRAGALRRLRSSDAARPARLQQQWSESSAITRSGRPSRSPPGVRSRATARRLALDVARPAARGAGDDCDRTAMGCGVRRSSRRACATAPASRTSRSTAAICSSSGLPRGPAIGEVAGRLLERVVDDPTLNTRERLLEEARGARVTVYRWDCGPAYEVVFSTRTGGVSEGPFASLNLGKLTLDREEHVEENRRRLCAEVGADVAKLALNRQQHSAIVNRAVAGSRGEPGDGLWTDEPGVPMLKLTADCVPIAIAREDGAALALLHAGWRGLLEGIVDAGVGGARRHVRAPPSARRSGRAATRSAQRSRTRFARASARKS